MRIWNLDLLVRANLINLHLKIYLLKQRLWNLKLSTQVEYVNLYKSAPDLQPVDMVINLEGRAQLEAKALEHVASLQHQSAWAINLLAVQDSIKLSQLVIYAVIRLIRPNPRLKRKIL